MKLEGEIGEIDLLERLVELGRERFTGAVRFENDGIIKIIYFKGGDILSASTNDRTDSVDEILLRAGKVSRDHVKQALARRKENETLGDALLTLGFITRKELTWARRVQVIGVIRSIHGWPAGSFQIVPDYLPKREEGTQFALPQILVEVVVTDQDRAKFDRAMDSGNAIFTKVDDFDFAWARLGLNQDADEIAAWIDGSHSASEIASLSGKDAFNVYKLLHALSLLGLLTRAGAAAPVAAAPDLGYAAEAVADASDVWGEQQPATPAPPMKSAFDDDDGIHTVDMPAWTPPPLETETEYAITPEPEPEPVPTTTVRVAPPPIPTAVAPEPQWGFDDAQLETSRRAVSAEEPTAMEVVEQASKPNRWITLLFIAVVIVGLTYGGFAAWQWYQQKNAPPAPTPIVHTRQHVKPPVVVAPPPAPTTTTVSTATTATATTAATATTNTAPPPATQTTASIAPTPVPAPAPAPAPAHPMVVKALPPVKAKSTTTITQNAAGTKVISNTTAPSSDATKSHYDEMAKTFAANATGNYTVQFELVCETSSLTKAIQSGGSSVWFVPITYRNRGCYRVFWGHYTTQDEAKRAASEIPMSLRGGGSAVVKVPKS